jgi:hypothetical protein
MKREGRRRLYLAALISAAIGVTLLSGSVRSGRAAARPARAGLTLRTASGATIPGGASEVVTVLSNEGTAGAAPLVKPTFTVTAPKGFTYVGATNLDRVPGFSGHGTPAGSISCRASAGGATCTYAGSLQAGGALAVLTSFKAPASLKPGGRAVFRATGVGKTSSASQRVVAGPGAPVLYTQATPVLVASDKPGHEVVDVLNTGPVAADSVQLANLLPDLVGSWTGTGSGWTCSGSQSAPPSCSYPHTVAPGHLAPPLRITFRLDASKVASLNLKIGGKPSIQDYSVAVTSTGGARTYTVQSPSELAVEAPPGAFLTVAATATRGLQELMPGASTTITTKVSNIGNATTDKGIALSVELPTSMSIERVSGGGSWDCKVVQERPTTQALACTPTAPIALKPRGTLAVRVTVKVAANAKPGMDQIGVAATASNEIADETPRPVSLPFLVLEPNAGFPALSLYRLGAKGALVPATDGEPGQVVSGQPFVERIDVRNAGGAPITAGETATLRQRLHGGARVKSIQAAAGWRCTGTTSLECTISFGADLAPAAVLTGPVVTITAGASSKKPVDWPAEIKLSGPNVAHAYRLPVLVDITHGEEKLVPNFTNDHVPTAGGVGVFGLSVGNEGNLSTKNAVHLGIDLPHGVHLQKIVETGWSCVTAARSARCTSAGPLKAGGHLPQLKLRTTFAKSTANRRLSLVAHASDGTHAAPKSAHASMLVEPRHWLVAKVREPDKVIWADMPLVRPNEKPKATVLTLEGDGSGGSGLGLQYHWVQRAGAHVKWLGPRNEADVEFAAPQVTKPSKLVFALTVTDGSATSTSTVRVKVLPLPKGNQGFSIRNAHPKKEKPNGPMSERRKLPKPAERVKGVNKPKTKTTRTAAAPTDTTTTPTTTGTTTTAPATTTGPTTTTTGAGLPPIFCQLVRDALSSGGSFHGTVGGVSFGFDNVTVSGSECVAGTTVGFSGASFGVSSLHASGVSGSISAGGLTISGGKLTGPESWHSPTFSIGGGGLTIPFTGGSISLEGTVTADGFAFVPLPSGWNGTTSLSFSAGGSGTSVSVDTTATGPAVDASTADSARPTAEVSGSIASDGTFSLAVNIQKIVQLAGSGINLTGSVKRESAGGAITSSFEGSLDAPITIVKGLTIAALAVKMQPTAETLGITGTGQIDVSTPTGTAGINVKLAYDNPRNWSLAAEGTGDATWTPLPGLTIAAKDFTGKVAAVDDKYELSLRVKPSNDWKPSSSVTISNLDLGLSNQCPNTGAPCPKDATVFFDISGDVAFHLPTIGTVNTSLKGALALPSGEFSVEAGLSQPLSVGAGISIDKAKVLIQRGFAEPMEDPTAETADKGDYRVDLEGAITVPGIGALPTVHASFGPSGWAVAVPLGSFSLPGGSGDGSKLGNAVVGWASYATKLNVTDPITKKLTQIDLPANTFKLTGDFSTPAWLKSTMGLKSDISGRATGIFDPEHDHYALRMDFQIGGQPYLYGNERSATNVRLNSTFFEIERSGGDFNIALGGAATMNVKGSKDIKDSKVDLTVALAYAVTSQTVTGSLSLDSPNGWRNAFGVDDLTLYKLAVQFSFNIPSLTPGIGFGASATLPATFKSKLGLVDSARTTLVANISVNNPCLGIQVDDPTNTGKTVLSIGNGALTAKSFGMYIAPTGCKVGTFTYAPGVSLNFDGNVAGVSLAIKATIGLSPFGIDGSATLGEFNVGGLTVLETNVTVKLNSSALKVTFSGGVNAFGTTVKVSGGIEKKGTAVVSDFTGSLDKLSIGNGAITANNLGVKIHTEVGAGPNVLTFAAQGTVTMFGSNADAKFALSLTNGVLNQATADVNANVNVGGSTGLALNGVFHVDYKTGSPLNVNANVSAKAGSFTLGQATVVVNNSYMSVSASFNVGTVFTATLAGAAYYGTPAAGTQITLPGGSKVNAKQGDFYMSATNLGLTVSGFSGTGSFFVGQVGGTFYANLNGSIQIVGTSGTNTVTVAGTVSGNGDFSLSGTANLDLAGFKPSVAVSVTKTGTKVAVSGAASIQILSSSIAVKGEFLYERGQFRFRLNGTGTLVAGGYTIANTNITFSNFQADAGLNASINLNAGGVVTVNGTLNIDANGGFYLSASARLNLGGIGGVDGNVVFYGGPTNVCVPVISSYITFLWFRIPVYGGQSCGLQNRTPTLIASASVSAGGFSFGVSATVDAAGNYTATASSPVSGDTTLSTPTVSFVVVRGYAYISYHMRLTIQNRSPQVAVDGFGSAGIKYQHWDVVWPPWDSGWSGWKDGGSISVSFKTNPFKACGYITIFGQSIGGCVP